MDPMDTTLQQQVAAPVALLHWPRDRGRRRQLQRLGIPRLLLVAADGPVPEVDDDEDWVRLPADEAEAAARLSALRSRRGGVTLQGTVLSTGWGSVTLSATEAAVIAVLLQPAGEIVPRNTLAQALAAHVTVTARTVDDVIYRLRRRVRPLGLDVFAARGRGHVLGPRLDWPVEADLVLD
jgi:hypothetical protein